MKRILLLVSALIVYGSFYPWRFQSADLPANPLWILLHSWPDSFDRFAYRDAAVNVTLYVPFGAFCFLSMRESRSRLFRWGATVLAGAALSASIEMGQLAAPGRVCSLFDLACNASGAAIGSVLAGAFPLRIHRAVSEAEAMGVFRLTAVTALLYLWAGYLLFPFFPITGRFALRAKLIAFSSPAPWQARVFLENLGGWLAASALLETLLGNRRIGRVLAAALMAVPLKLFLVDRSMSRSEIAGAIAGVAFWSLFRALRSPMRAAAAAALTALILTELAPFHFTSARQAFTWIPFLSLLQTPWGSAFVILFKKSFLYGSVIWLLNRSGQGWVAGSLMVSAVLAILEIVQIFLPGRTPELTDPVLAILAGLCLMALDRPADRPEPAACSAIAPSRDGSST